MAAISGAYAWDVSGKPVSAFNAGEFQAGGLVADFLANNGGPSLLGYPLKYPRIEPFPL